MLTAEQLEQRKTGIGGSDVAAILGLSPWKSAFQLYMEKRGEFTEAPKESEVIHFGNVLEDVVADEYARRNGVKVQRRNDMIIHPEFEFMLANIDRKVVGTRKGLECKTADKFTRGKWGESGTDQIPDFYRIQDEHYMNVTGYSEWDTAVLIGGNEYREYPIVRDPEIGDMLVTACKDFWQRVTDGNPPEIDFAHATTIDLIKQMNPGTNGETITLPPELYYWHKVKIDAEAEVKRYQAVADTCKARILEAIGENSAGQLPDAAYQYKRTIVKKKEFISPATSYVQMRGSAIRQKKS